MVATRCGSMFISLKLPISLFIFSNNIIVLYVRHVHNCFNGLISFQALAYSNSSYIFNLNTQIWKFLTIVVPGTTRLQYSKAFKSCPYCLYAADQQVQRYNSFRPSCVYCFALFFM